MAPSVKNYEVKQCYCSKQKFLFLLPTYKKTTKLVPIFYYAKNISLANFQLPVFTTEVEGRNWEKSTSVARLSLQAQ